MAFNVPFKNQFFKNVKQALDTYYSKTSYALYRFKSRIIQDKIPYAPTIFGDEDVQTVGKTITNTLIKHKIKYQAHPEEPHFPNEYSLDGPPKGRIYNVNPFKFKVEKNKAYLWCSCGYSNNQPFCDNTHKIHWTTNLVKRTPKFRPIKFVSDEEKEVWFCNCKQSSERPLCDGTCKTEKVRPKKEAWKSSSAK